ncbi:MAG: cytochrome c biogenesis protein CcdA [bacterium]|nr:cytochrome c biogenesis protein CcdA [bacterium]
MDAIYGASIIASFLAGMVALFAPCCITVLLPSYMASAFRQKRDILRMTIVFFAGISTVLIPIGLGAAWLAEIFQDFHTQLWLFGGLFMVLLGVFSILGKGISLPFAEKLKSRLKIDSENHSYSVYVLGVLSGAATSCCAPVLAGAMALAVVSGGFWNAIVVIFAYVFGMVFPLFVAAYMYDKYDIAQSALIKGKLFSVSIFGKQHIVHSTNILSAVMFLLIGGTMMYLSISDNAYWAPEHQIAVGKALNVFTLDVFSYLEKMPDIIWGAVVLGLFAFFVRRSRKKTAVVERTNISERGSTLPEEDNSPKSSCH